MEIRALRADEIECRVQQVTRKGVMLLLYKDARADMAILDEHFTSFGWKRAHEVVNNKEFCTVSIRDPETKEWVSKQDCGTVSNTEKEKGQTSDAFKRACFNWGIGRELYTKILIFIKIETAEISKGKFEMVDKYAKFRVSKIDTDNQAKKILHLEIVDKFNKKVFDWDNANPPKYEDLQKDIEQVLTNEQIKLMFAIAKEKNVKTEQLRATISKWFNKDSTRLLTIPEYDVIMLYLENTKTPDSH